MVRCLSFKRTPGKLGKITSKGIKIILKSWKMYLMKTGEGN